MIPLPRPWLLTGTMLVGAAVGVLLGVAGTLLVTTRVRPDLAIALALAVPTVLGLTMLLFSTRRWVTAAGAFLVAVAPGWFGVLVLTQVVHGG
ncbi:MAG TPA: putative holin [Mycobacterium sp.]|nr:putative holin [Mycobacterium sp.]